MNRYLYKSLAMLLALSLSGGELFAAATAAMLRSKGGVSVNGAPVTPVTTVFSGDRIETAPEAAGSLTIGGSSLILDPNSSMVFSGQSLDFYCGGGTVQANQGMTARYGNTFVRPAKDSARYQVHQAGAVVRVAALDGDLTVTEGARNFTVPSGSSMNVAYTGCSQIAQNSPQGTQSPASTSSAPNQQPNPQTPTPINTSDTKLTTALVVAPSIVAAVAVAGIIAVSQNPVSSTGP